MSEDSARTAVDVIIPTRDRPADLERVLRSMCAQTVTNFRVFVFDQSADTAASRAVVDACEDPRISHITHGRSGKSLALNDGVLMSESRIIAFTDDDCEVPADWLELALAHMEVQPTADLLFGRVLACPHDPEVLWVPVIEFESTSVYRGPIVRAPKLVGMGANMFASRSALLHVGLFDEDLGPGGPLFTGEEFELTYRMLQHRYVVSRVPDLTVIHHGARAIGDGTARQHLILADYACSAAYGKHLRARDWRSVLVVADEFRWRSSLVLRSLARRRRPFNVMYLKVFLSGIAAGWKAGPNWHSPGR